MAIWFSYDVPNRHRSEMLARRPSDQARPADRASNLAPPGNPSALIDEVLCIIEIPKGSRNKYVSEPTFPG
jgi:hypothetical protein